MFWLSMSCSGSGGMAGVRGMGVWHGACLGTWHGTEHIRTHTPPEPPSDIIFPLRYFTVPPHKLMCCFLKQCISVF